MRSIGDNAFGACPDLRHVAIPASVRVLGVGVFNDNFTFRDDGEPIGIESIYFEGNAPSAGPQALTLGASHVGGPVRVYRFRSP